MVKNFVDFNGKSIEVDMAVDNSTPGLMTNQDKTKLDGIAAGANAYTHPSAHPASIITQDASNRFVTDTEKSNWNAKAGITIATTSANGLMSAADKTKLDGIAAGANAYTHPNTHPASIITQDASNRFVTDTEKSNWNSKAGTTVATATVNGLMSAADKTKLDGIATAANAYIHPTTHPASIIVQNTTNRFVTDAEKTAWNAKAGTAIATTSANGLMSAADKTKLNNLSYDYIASDNSYYKKYGDGTLDMWGRFTFLYTNELWAGNLSSSGLSYSVPFTITLPIATVGIGSCNINIESDNVSWASIYSITTTAVKYIIICGSPDKVYGAMVHWSVKGKWK